MRLGAYACTLEEGTLAARAYGELEISERHRHRYEFNNRYRPLFEEHGMRFSGHHTIGQDAPRRSDRAAARDAPVVRRHAGASGVQVAAEPAVAALSRLHRCGACARSAAHRRRRGRCARRRPGLQAYHRRRPHARRRAQPAARADEPAARHRDARARRRVARRHGGVRARRGRDASSSALDRFRRRAALRAGAGRDAVDVDARCRRSARRRAARRDRARSRRTCDAIRACAGRRISAASRCASGATNALLRLFRTRSRATRRAARRRRRGADLHEALDVRRRDRAISPGRCCHYSYPDVAAYRAKFDRYTALEARGCRVRRRGLALRAAAPAARFAWLLLAQRRAARRLARLVRRVSLGAAIRPSRLRKALRRRDRRRCAHRTRRARDAADVGRHEERTRASWRARLPRVAPEFDVRASSRDGGELRLATSRSRLPLAMRARATSISCTSSSLYVAAVVPRALRRSRSTT